MTDPYYFELNPSRCEFEPQGYQVYCNFFYEGTVRLHCEFEDLDHAQAGDAQDSESRRFSDLGGIPPCLVDYFDRPDPFRSLDHRVGRAECIFEPNGISPSSAECDDWRE